MAVKVGINGFGRIGRITLRAMLARKGEFDLVGINDLGDPAALANLLKYDSVQGKFPGTVEVDGDSLVVNGDKLKVYSERNPAELPWGEIGCDVVVEATGIFTGRKTDSKPGYDSHLDAGAKKVVLSAPAKDEVDLTVVMGVNDGDLTGEHKCISNASCTTNSLAPVVKVLDQQFGLVEGLMTTVHAYTNDQHVTDAFHKDPHRARAAALSIIPTTTGAAKAVGKVYPAVAGKLTGFSLRVPVPAGSVTDLTATLKGSPSVEEINAAMKAASEGELKGILEYTEDPIVSSDIVGNPHSAIFGAEWTTRMGDNMVKLLSWYDNEFGYSNRTADLVAKVAGL
ncbi:MAG: type I glyceraldehyde-3-phosphate dehydrogenase [Planctomycetota bacterium]